MKEIPVWVFIFFGLSLLFVIFAIYMILPLPKIPCGFHLLTGHPCPSCGTSRVLNYLTHLDYFDAVKINPFITISFTLLLIYIIINLLIYPSGRVMEINMKEKAKIPVILLIAVLFLLNWAYMWHMGI